MFVDSLESLQRVDFHTMSVVDASNYEFASLDLAYAFYNQYRKMNGFGIQRHNVGRSVNNIILWQTFVCCKKGQRDIKHLERDNCKRDPKPLMRCGSEVKMQVHLDMMRNRWYLTIFYDDHNHELLSLKFYGMLRSHRRMNECC